MNVANAIWGKKDFGWSPDWLALQKDRFGSELHEADFRRSPDTERKRIIKWVEEKTSKRIQDVLRRDQVTGIRFRFS